MNHKYKIAEIFLSIQGEGARAGTVNVFVRFAGCNRKCTKEVDGFDCDTVISAESIREMTAREIVEECEKLSPVHRWVILTGGEPLLQADEDLMMNFKFNDWKIAVETNGTVSLTDWMESNIDYLAVSPKGSDDLIRIRAADEVRYVVKEGDEIPIPKIVGNQKFISPAWKMPRSLAWAILLVLRNPTWKLSTQQHKLWGIR